MFSPLQDGTALFLIGWVCFCWSLGYFLYVVLLIGFFVANTNAQRLFVDSVISACLMILSSAGLFHAYGIISPDEAAVTNRDLVYFSAVTFSTLGFGDFRPAADARLIAASLAILGNLHLAVLVGAVFRSMR
ncbi:MAG: two pore domain potassium channel family protein [Rhodobacteraceae bacterium]|nr:two pore domain potassium channel family protein [Paracoccaceae bacterium]